MTRREAAGADGRAVTSDTGGPVALNRQGLPDWLQPVVRLAATVRPQQLSRYLPPPHGGRPAAVLVLFGDARDAGEAGGAGDAAGGAGSDPRPDRGGGGADTPGPPGRGPELLLTERAPSLRDHAGQPSFPGGALDPEDGDPADPLAPLRAALREAQEETGLDPGGVQLFATLPRLYIPVSDFVVTPVLGWWHTRSPVAPVDAAETARVFTVPIADLADPANRATAVHPRGHRGPCFLVNDAVVWGFTAGVIDRILHHAGWERPWNRGRRVLLEPRS